MEDELVAGAEKAVLSVFADLQKAFDSEQDTREVSLYFASQQCSNKGRMRFRSKG
jgi:hypothetical protein